MVKMLEDNVNKDMTINKTKLKNPKLTQTNLYSFLKMQQYYFKKQFNRIDSESEVHYQWNNLLLKLESSL